MPFEIRLNNRIASIELIQRNNQKVTLEVDGSLYEVDLEMVETGVYSILHKGKSFNVELIPGNHSKSFTVNTLKNTYEVEIIDAQTRYRRSRKDNHPSSENKNIIAPMPGKVIKIPVKEGQLVKQGETVIVLAAMKMESEFKAPTDGSIHRINVQEGETVDGNQVLIEIG